MITCVARAKINLALHVTGIRADGLHSLDSIVVFSEFGDLLEISGCVADEAVTLHIDGPFASDLTQGGDNLVTRAALLLRDKVAARSTKLLEPVLIRLEKNLPLASGIGGGSADAAAALLGLQEHWQSDENLFPLADQLGADIAMCLHSRPLRAQGKGEEITLLKNTAALNMVLVNPGIEVSTPDVFRALENKHNAPAFDAETGQFPTLDKLRSLRNDLQTPAQLLVPEISQVLNVLAEFNPALARMSGSGATCFAVFETMSDAETTCREIRNSHPQWWCVATRSTVS